MINKIALTNVMGLPAVAWGGVFTFLLLLFTASVAYFNSIGKPIIPFKWHPKLALLTIVVALIHGIAGLSVFLGF